MPPQGALFWLGYFIPAMLLVYYMWRKLGFSLHFTNADGSPLSRKDWFWFIFEVIALYTVLWIIFLAAIGVIPLPWE
jgi:hypothetical protein